MPNSLVMTTFAPSQPQFTTVAGSMRAMTKQEIKKSRAYPENKKLKDRIKTAMDASDGNEILKRETVWVNPDGTVVLIRDASSSDAVAKAMLKAEKDDHRRELRRREQRNRRYEKGQGGKSAEGAPLANTLYSPTISEQTSSSMAAQFQRNPSADFVGMSPQQAPHSSRDDFNGQHGKLQQNSKKLQRHKSCQANSSGEADGSRSLFPLLGSNKSLNNEVSHNKLTASRTLQRSPGYRQIPDATTQTASPCRSNGPLSPSLTDWSQYRNYAAAPQHSPSFALKPQTFGHYLQASDVDVSDFESTVLPHRLADSGPHYNYQVTSTNYAPSINAVLQINESDYLAQQKTYQSSQYPNSISDYGVAGRVPQIASTGHFGQSAPTGAAGHYDLAGQMVYSQYLSNQDNFSETEVTLALGNRTRRAPGPKFYSGWDVNN